MTTIACAVDTSPGSEAALAVAARLARAIDAELVLIHVDQAPAEEALLAPPPARIPRGRVEQERWTAAATDLRGEQVSLQLLRGEPAEAIVQFARKAGCEFVVLGSRARNRVTLALGSTAAKVLVAAPCPVIVVPPRGAEREQLKADFPGQVA